MLCSLYLFICFVSDITDLGKVLTVLKDNHFPDDQWDDLGLKLGIIQTELKTIKKDNQDSNDRLKECLSRWLQQSYDTTQYGLPSMESLVTALRGMDLNATASKLVPGVIMSAQHGKFNVIPLYRGCSVTSHLPSNGN